MASLQLFNASNYWRATGVYPIAIPANTVGTRFQADSWPARDITIRPAGDYLYTLVTYGGNLTDTYIRETNALTYAESTSTSVPYIPNFIAAAPDSSALWATGGNTLIRLTLPLYLRRTPTLSAANPGYNNTGLAISPDYSKIYVADPTLGAIYTYTIATNTWTTLRSGLTSPNAVSITPDGTLLVVGHEHSRYDLDRFDGGRQFGGHGVDGMCRI